MAVPGAFTKASTIVIPYVIVVVVLVLIGLVAQFVYRFVDPLASASPTTNMLVHGSMAAILLIVFPVIVLVLSATDYQDQVATAPWFRAVGEMSVYGFMIVLLPVCHRVSLPAIFLRTSYERSTGMHALLGIFILLTVTIHGVGMALNGVNSFSDVFSAETPKRNIFGVIAWVLLVIMSIPALLWGRGIPRMFATFRITHLLNVFIILCGAVHCPKLIIVLLPGLVSYLGDVAWRAYQDYSVNKKSFVIDAEYNAEAGVTALQIKCRGLQQHQRQKDSSEGGGEVNTEGSPISTYLLDHVGKHVLLRIGNLGALAHPISIALMDPHQGVITLFIKNTACVGDEKSAAPDPRSHRWTERLASIASRSAQGLVTPERADETQGNIFSVSVISLLDSTAIVPLRTLLGYHNDINNHLLCCQTSSTPSSCDADDDDNNLPNIKIVLVAGGIGITPILSYLQGISSVTTFTKENDGGDGVEVPAASTTSTGRPRHVGVSIVVVWSVREAGMQAYFEPLLQELLYSINTHVVLPKTATSSLCHTPLVVSSVALHIFQTAVDTTPLLAGAFSSSGVLHREESSPPQPHSHQTAMTEVSVAQRHKEEDRTAITSRRHSVRSSSATSLDDDLGGGVSPIGGDIVNTAITNTALRFLTRRHNQSPQSMVDISQQVTHTSSSSVVVSQHHHRGRPTAGALSDMVSKMPGGGGGVGVVYACGPPGVMDLAKETAQNAGLLHHYEAF